MAAACSPNIRSSWLSIVAAGRLSARPMSQPSPPQSSFTVADVISLFHQVYWQLGDSTWKRTSWMGVPTLKCPLDLWVYQEIVFYIRPQFILETGTCHGG